MNHQQFIQQLKSKDRLGAAPSNDFLNDMLAALSAIGDQFDELAQNRIVSLNQQAGAVFENLANQVTFVETRQSALNESFGVTSAAAQKINRVLIEQGKALNQSLAPGFKISNLEMQKYAIGLKKMLPTVDQFNNKVSSSGLQKRLLQTQRILRGNLKLSEEQANSYTQFAEASEHGATAQLRFQRAFAKELDPEGTLGYFNMITEEIAAAGSEIQLQYGAIPGELESAVIKAKKLGFSLQDVTKVGEKMLNIESSIGDELEYQLLSGKRLVDQETGESFTNKLRIATLQGDASAQAETLNKIIAQQGKGLEKNLFARKQLAKTLGIEEKQLASAIQKQKILDKYSQKYGLSIDIDDDGAINKAAQELAKTGELTATELKQFTEDTDLRTTDDLIKEQLILNREQKMIELLQAQDLMAIREKLTTGADDFSNMTMANVNQDPGLLASIIGGVAIADYISSEVSAINLEKAKTEKADLGTTEKRALGGAVMAGKPYLVGEQGQELFLPPVNGTIISNENTQNGTAIKADFDDSNIVTELKKMVDIMRASGGSAINGPRQDF